MTAEDSNRVAFEKQELDDTLSCCVCTEFYTDPKALPCIHTFCMKCLQQIGHNANKGPGDEMPCPICRRQFKIPQEGFSGLPNNFLIAKLIEVANVSNPSESSRNLCDVCLGNEEETGSEIPEALMFCIDCNQKLCEECRRHHRKSKLSKNHKLISINEQQANNDCAMAKLAPSVCKLHEQKVLDIYCDECKTVECAVCFIDRHKHHEGSHVSKYVDDFRKQIESNVETINQCSSKTQMKKAELVKIKEEMQQRVESLEEDVMKRRDELKQFADSQANSLLQSLSSLSRSKLKEIQMEADDIDAHLSCLQSYSSYCQKMMAQGSASDICRAVFDLTVKATELQEQCQSLIERKIEFFKVSFMKSEFEEFLQDDNLIGEIEEDCESRQRKTSMPKVALMKRQSSEIDLLKKDINLERREKETFRLENEQLKMIVNSEKESNEMLREVLYKNSASCHVEISQLKLDLDNEKTTSKTFQANTEKQIQKLNEDLDFEKTKNTTLQDDNKKLSWELEKTKTDWRAKILDLEQKREEERKTSAKEKQQLISQIQEHNRLMDKLRREYKLDATLVQTIRTKAAEEKKKSIQGLTILDNELFVLSEKSSEVEVYDSMTVSFSRRWNLKELIQPQDIASCSRNKCLYIFDYKGIWQNEILRVDPNGNLIKKWSTGSNFGYSISVTDESNVILPVYNNSKLNEYSPDGRLIRELKIQSGSAFCELWHAVKLANGHFVVSLRSADSTATHLLFVHHVYGDSMHKVCIVNGDGKLEKSFSEKFTSSVVPFHVPFHLSVDRNGLVMVVDRDKRRVFLLDSYLGFKKEILSNEEKQVLRYPTKIHLNKSNDRLFLADNNSNKQRVLIFDFK